MPLFIYGITESDNLQPIQAKAIIDPDAKVEVLSCGSLCAIASHIQDKDVLPIRRNLLGHSKVLEEVMEQQTVIPMQFGVIVDDQGILCQLINNNLQTLKTMIDELDGRIEVGIKMRWDEKIVFHEIIQDHPQLHKTGADLNNRDENETYYDRIELGRTVSQIIEMKRIDEGNTVLNRLAPNAVKVIKLDPSDEFTIINLALLVEKSQEENLFKEVQAIDEIEGERMQIKYVSPIPPYNFVSQKLDWQKNAA